MTGIHTGVPSRGGHLLPDVHGGSASLIHQATRTVINAEMITLPTSAVVIVGSPGANRVLVRVNSSPTFDINIVTAYATVTNPVSTKLRLEVGRGITIGEISFFDWNFDDFQSLHWPGSDSSNAVGDVSGGSAVVDASMDLFVIGQNDGDFTGGNASNTVTPSIAFMVWDLTTHRYLDTDESGWDADTRTFTT